MTTFSLRRVAQYTAKHYAEYGRLYAMLFGSVIAILSVTALMIVSKKELFNEFLPVELIYEGALAILPAMVLCVAALSVHSLDRTTNRATFELTLPLSDAERYTFVFLNTLIVGVLVPFVIFCIFNHGIYHKVSLIVGLFFLVHPYVLVAYCWARRHKYAILGLTLLWALTMFSLASVSSTIGMPAFGNYLHFSLPESYEFFKAGPMMYGSGIEFDYPMWVEWLFTVVMWALAYVIAYFKLRERRLA